MALGHVVVRQSGIKWVPHWDEPGWSEACPLHGVIVAAVVAYPVQIPGTLGVRNRIPFGCLLSDPEPGRSDVVLPRISARIGVRGDSGKTSQGIIRTRRNGRRSKTTF